MTRAPQHKCVAPIGFLTLVCYSRDARSGVIVFEWVRADGGLPYPFGYGFTVMVYRISSF
jgi:hypothetical protein